MLASARFEMRPLFFRPPSTARLGLILRLTTCLLALVVGCAEEDLETVVELAAFAPYQRHNVSTRLVSPADELTPWLATHGWRIDSENEPSATGGRATMAINRDRARLWFFSAGDTRGVEISGTLLKARKQRRRQVVYRLNGESSGHFSMLPGSGTYVIEFDPSQIRQGWNSLELRPRRSSESGDAGIRLRGLRFFDHSETFDARAQARQIEQADGRLIMPAGSLLEAVFELPPGARFRSEVTADGGTDRIEIELLLTAGDEPEIELSKTSIEIGKTLRIDHDLSRWQGQRVRLRTVVNSSPDGPPEGSAVWGEARIARTAGAQEEDLASPRPKVFERLIQPVSPAGDRRLGRPDLVVILLDAARADAFSPWGGPYATPVIESLASAGTRFERALSPSSWTGQSMPSIFTGFHPDTLGVHKWGDSLTDAVPTLAELLSSAGYRTTLWSQHPLYSRGPTLSRGFEQVVYSSRRKRDRLPAIGTLLSDGQPNFTFFHLLPPHSPYSPPPPFAGRYTSWFQGQSPPQLGNLNRYPKRRDPAELSATDRKYIRDRYQENVSFADALVGRIVDGLKADGRYDQTLIVVISDHGEGFLEHNRFMHSRRLYQEFVHVPFVIKWPSGVDGFRPVVEETVSLVDLVPTLVAGLDLPGGEKGFQGHDLSAHLFEGGSFDRAIYAVTRGDGDPLRAPKPRLRLEYDGWALMFDPLLDQIELYDLANDPSELNDLASRHPMLAAAMLQDLRMQRFFNRTLLGLEAVDSGDLDPELAAELKALGYL